MSDFDLDDFNILDKNAKKVLEALSEFNEGEFATGVSNTQENRPNSN